VLRQTTTALLALIILGTAGCTGEVERALKDSVKYILEPRSDGEWIRWYPRNEAQEREIGLKVAEHRFELKRGKAASGAK
jgi:hypothetical protein